MLKTCKKKKSINLSIRRGEIYQSSKKEKEKRQDHASQHNSMMALRYDTEGILWRARADKAAVMRRQGEADDDDGEESSGVDTENEDVDETDFDFHYLKALDYQRTGDLPLLPEATDRGLPRRTAAPAGGKRRARAPPADAFAFDASQQTQSTTFAPSQVPSPLSFSLVPPLLSCAHATMCAKGGRGRFQRAG
jgi:hypothetical protein